MRFYTTERLSNNQELTPEGFLLAKDVRIARTGAMLYAAGEVPVEATADGIIRIERTPEEVFRDETICSFEGKPLTIDHPPIDVNPSNWSQFAKGVVHHVRRGSGMDSDFLIANLLITDHEAIEIVRKKGIREVSAGYDAAYEQIRPGVGAQHEIVGNHVALVEYGRCGAKCAIGDKQPMVDIKKWKDRLLTAFKSNDAAAFESVLAEDTTPTPTNDATRVTLDSIQARLISQDSRIGVMEKKLAALRTKDEDGSDDDETAEEKAARLKKEKAEAAKEEAEEAEEDADEAKKDADEDEDEDDDDDGEKKSRKRSDDRAPAGLTARQRSEVQDTFSRVEILSPGMRLPTFDAKASPKKVRDSLCSLRRATLAKAYETKDGRDAIAPFVGGIESKPDFKAMTCDAVSAALIGSSEIIKRDINGRNATAMSFDAGKTAEKARLSIAEINKLNASAWASRQ